MSHKPKVAKLDGLAKLPHLTVHFIIIWQSCAAVLRGTRVCTLHCHLDLGILDRV